MSLTSYNNINEQVSEEKYDSMMSKMMLYDVAAFELNSILLNFNKMSMSLGMKVEWSETDLK